MTVDLLTVPFAPTKSFLFLKMNVNPPPASVDRASKMKILLCIEPSPFTWISGYKDRFQNLLKFLKRNGDDCSILTTDSSASPPTQCFDFPITYTPGFHCFFYPCQNYTLCCDLPSLKGIEIIKKNRPDLIHATSPGFLINIVTFCYAKLYSIPLVISYHTNLPEYAKKYIWWIPGAYKILWLYLRILHYFADLTLVTSSQIQKEMNQNGIQNVKIWKKGVDTMQFSPSYYSLEMRNRLTDNHPLDKVLLYVGRLSIEKNINCLHGVLKLLPNVRLAIVGKGPAESALKRLFKNNRVVMLGELTGKELSEAYASSDVFCFPSTSETLGLVLLEAMASGIPVVAAAAGGVSDIISHDSNGLLAEPDNPLSMATQIQYLLDDVNAYKRISTEGHVTAKNNNWSNSMEDLRHNLYPETISNFKKNKISWMCSFHITTNPCYNLVKCLTNFASKAVTSPKKIFNYLTYTYTAMKSIALDLPSISSIPKNLKHFLLNKYKND